MVKENKIKKFIDAINEGKTRDEAINISGVAKSTANVVLNKLKRQKQESQESN